MNTVVHYSPRPDVLGATGLVNTVAGAKITHLPIHHIPVHDALGVRAMVLLGGRQQPVAHLVCDGAPEHRVSIVFIAAGTNIGNLLARVESDHVELNG